MCVHTCLFIILKLVIIRQSISINYIVTYFVVKITLKMTVSLIRGGISIANDTCVEVPILFMV